MKKDRIFLLLLLSFLLGGRQAAPAQISAMSKPKVLVITTGGTIASQVAAPLLEGPALVQAVPQLNMYADVTVEEFVRTGSSKITPQHWLALVKKINTALSEQPDLRCIVITHGTDTMEETAFFLHLTHHSEVPVVLVGAMRSANEVSADGPANLISAVRVGIADEARGKGVLVVMNDNISGARDLYKTNNKRVDAFVATEQGYLGYVDPEAIVFFREPGKTHTIHSDFDVYALDSLPKVDLVSDFAGMDPEIISYFLERPNAGLVISTFAGGRMSKGGEAIFHLPENRKPVVIASGIRGGRVMGAGDPDIPIIIANDLPPNKARILLMLALTKSTDYGLIQTYFQQY